MSHFHFSFFHDRRLHLALAVFAAFVMLFAFQAALAAPPASGLTIEMRTPNLLYMDFNDWCSYGAIDGPDGGWYHLRVTNSLLNETYTGLQLTLVAPLNTVIDDPLRYLGNLAPGESRDVFFFIDYRPLRNWRPCANSDPPINYNRPFTVTVSSLNGGMDGVRTFSSAYTAEGMISANAGGQYVSHNLGPGDYVGQLLTMTVVYRYGNNANGSSLFIQPNGNGDFDDRCYRMVGSRVIASNVDGVVAGVTNTLYFSNIDTRNRDSITMEYTFEALCSGGGTSAYAWSEVTSGDDQRYRQSSYNSNPIPLPNPQPVSNSLRISKSVSPTQLTNGGLATYSVRFENRAPLPLYINRIIDQMPNGMSYQGFAPGSDVVAANSSVSPTLGAIGSLNWYSKPGISYRIPASGTLGVGQPGVLQLIYTAQLTNTVGLYTNWVSAVVGNDQTTPVSATVQVGSPTAVTLASFEALPQAQGILLTWTTLVEIETVGFNLYRRALPEGELTLVNPALIPSQMPGGANVLGATYTYLDENAAMGVVYEYWLEEVDVYGHGARYGPVNVRRLALSDAIQLFLPMIRKP
jgi:hypothetical protein